MLLKSLHVIDCQLLCFSYLQEDVSQKGECEWFGLSAHFSTTWRVPRGLYHLVCEGGPTICLALVEILLEPGILFLCVERRGAE